MQQWTEAMRAGRYEDAWAMEAATLAARNPATRDDPALPYHLRWVWDGRAVDGRDVLVRCYHGLGDTIQFARYLPLLARRARGVTLEVQPRLMPLLAGIGVDRIVPFDVARPLPPADCDIEITELPRAIGVAPDRVSAPYLAWPAADLAPGTVGICHIAGDWDPERSVPAELFRTICERHPCIMLAAGETTLPCRNPQGCPLDMEETAALVSAVDLVITVDTMIAHLAGAMGKPTWLLLKAEPDWRWSPGRRDSPWYPAMRLYAQPSAGDWRSVLTIVADDLARFRSTRA
ncbi:glycosyltransferase family 9 protein [Sphingomonas sp.]|uniref:glycosyltransferase family 9 protein n=1 Tax=Sphingomonas sp. TaxID=28214 RepID=UPI0035BBB98C